MKQTINELIDTLAQQDTSIETQLLAPKLIKQLYKQKGDPTPEEFPTLHNMGTYFKHVEGYTKYMPVITTQTLKQEPVDYHIKRPSETKQRIIDRYFDDGWNIRVLAYNVMCDKYIQSTVDPRLAVHIIHTRDCSKYEYAIIKEQ